MTEEEREQQWSPLTSESGSEDDLSSPPTPLSNPSLTNEEMQQYSSGHAMVIYGPSIDVSECQTYCTLDSDGNFVEESSSEEEQVFCLGLEKKNCWIFVEKKTLHWDFC